ncbi:hypothetical protein ACJIZ3_014417 [Penstemon smallii]|uniref:Secreted protein n=1 Tax=Penstemon smallii TaxID=265156 RepID=A0ABD3RKA4_9LAMI
MCRTTFPCKTELQNMLVPNLLHTYVLCTPFASLGCIFCSFAEAHSADQKNVQARRELRGYKEQTIKRSDSSKYELMDTTFCLGPIRISFQLHK